MSIRAVLDDAARGRPPAADGVVEVVPAPPGGLSAVLAFTAHHVIAADIDPDEVLRRLPRDDLSAPTSPAFLLWLGERIGAKPGVVDISFVAEPADVGAEQGVSLMRSTDRHSHPRVQRSSRYRDESDVFVDPDDRGLVVLGRGFAGRLEMAFEVAPEWRGNGLGRRLAVAARRLAPADEPLFAQVSPGNVASVRAILAAGYRPIGSEVLFAVAQACP